MCGGLPYESVIPESYPDPSRRIFRNRRAVTVEQGTTFRKVGDCGEIRFESHTSEGITEVGKHPAKIDDADPEAYLRRGCQLRR
jgi:hypothetical protein